MSYFELQINLKTFSYKNTAKLGGQEMKRIVTIIVAMLVIIFSFSASAAEINFTDVKTTDWFYKNLQELTEKNIISGYQDSTFKPDNTLKFEELIKMLVVAVEGEQVNQKEEQEWHQIYIDKASESKYITEQQKSLIGQNIDRQTMAEILYNVLTEKEKITAYDNAEFQYLSDRLTDIDKTDVKTLTINGIGVISGYPDGTFKPDGTLTRAEAVAVISRVINPELRNPVKIVKRDANGIIDANDLDKITIEEADYKVLKDYYKTDLSGSVVCNIGNVIKADTLMFPIKYGNLVITGVEKLKAGDTLYRFKNGLGFDNGIYQDRIVIHAYAINENDYMFGDKFEGYYKLFPSFNVIILHKSGGTSIIGVNGVMETEVLFDQTRYTELEDIIEKVELNKSFTHIIGIPKVEKLEDIDKFIIMEKRNVTNDVLEIDLRYIESIDTDTIKLP